MKIAQCGIPLRVLNIIIYYWQALCIRYIKSFNKQERQYPVIPSVRLHTAFGKVYLKWFSFHCHCMESVARVFPKGGSRQGVITVSLHVSLKERSNLWVLFFRRWSITRWPRTSTKCTKRVSFGRLQRIVQRLILFLSNVLTLIVATRQLPSLSGKVLNLLISVPSSAQQEALIIHTDQIQSV